MNIKVVEFYNTGICESEPKSVVRLDNDEDLLHALKMELHNLEEAEHLQVRIITMTKKQWDKAVREGEV